MSALQKGIEVSSLMGADIDYFITLDCENIPFTEDFFDCIIGMAILHHLPNPAKALSEIRRTLKPGGFYLGLGAGVANPLVAKVYRKVCDVEKRAHKLGIIEATYPYKYWKEMLKNARFKNYTINFYKDYEYIYDTRRRLYYWIAKRVPDSLKKHFLSGIQIYAEK